MFTNCNRLLWALVIINLIATIGLGIYTVRGDAVERWVVANPQKIFDTVNEHLQGGGKEAEDRTMQTIKDNHAFLYEDARHPFLGNRNAGATIIEFMDYNCGYCKKAYEVLAQLVQEDKDVRVVLIEIPILAPSSATAAKWALAAYRMGGYADFHKKLMEHRGEINDEVLSQYAKDAGLNPAKVKAMAETPEIGGIVALNLKKSNEIGISGTPGFIIGEQLFRGYIDLPVMKAAIAEMREHQ